MALYLGSDKKVSFALRDRFCKPYVVIVNKNNNQDRLLSFDNLVLQDVNGLYLTVKESE